MSATKPVASKGIYTYELQYDDPGVWLIDSGCRLDGHVMKEGKRFVAHCKARTGEGKTRNAAIEAAVKQAGYSSAKHI